MSPKNENASRAARCASSFATMRLNGQHTGSTDLLLTENGEKRVKSTGKALEGDDRLIVSKNLAHDMSPPAEERNEGSDPLRLDAKIAYHGYTRGKTRLYVPKHRLKSPKLSVNGTMVIAKA
ncbi:hypothetical protein ACO22_00558 [Paracoccidioides brasiliensis]|uniref:Uncharacterized protein n=1 Tax=Paracoccidioides brasiliensis TaxID=121759 RepID=A0A1D2JP33_PARBR|nr:hypothetical protein ACO22_00558 [Paracoccidioides brasiliensis]